MIFKNNCGCGVQNLSKYLFGRGKPKRIPCTFGLPLFTKRKRRRKNPVWSNRSAADLYFLIYVIQFNR
jgi:hypothetical protein